MMTYPKIQSVYKRDEKTSFKTFIMGEYSTPEIEYLASSKWEYTEKVDGTNIRAIWDKDHWYFKGKTDKAEIPTFLVDALYELFTPTTSATNKLFEGQQVCFYGEGYGPKIQKVGGNYRSTPSFVLFDIFIKRFWLKREDIEVIASALGIDTVPILKYGDIHDAIRMCINGFKSQWGDFTAEGLVLKPAIQLFDRMGDRIITKLKYKDFNEKVD